LKEREVFSQDSISYPMMIYSKLLDKPKILNLFRSTSRRFSRVLTLSASLSKAVELKRLTRSLSSSLKRGKLLSSVKQLPSMLVLSNGWKDWWTQWRSLSKTSSTSITWKTCKAARNFLKEISYWRSLDLLKVKYSLLALRWLGQLRSLRLWFSLRQH